MDNISEDKKMLIVLVERDLYERLSSVANDKGMSVVEFANQVLNSISFVEVVKRDFLTDNTVTRPSFSNTGIPGVDDAIIDTEPFLEDFEPESSVQADAQDAEDPLDGLY